LETVTANAAVARLLCQVVSHTYTLMLQLVHTRILSALGWFHLAFVVFSMAMFGLTAGAVWLYLPRETGHRSPLGETTCL